MNSSPSNSRNAAAYELRYRSLFNEGRGYSFPCDGAGHVDMDALSDAARCNYLFARALVGRDLALPVVQPSAAH
jgi:hypothetical protein